MPELENEGPKSERGPYGPDEERDLFTAACAEIADLRRRNEILSAKVEVMDLFACVLHTIPFSNPQGFGEDIVWRMQQRIHELEMGLGNKV